MKYACWAGRSASLVALLIFAATAALAQGGSAQKSDAPDTHQRPEATKPGPEQDFLAKRAGEYTRKVKFVTQPDADANAFSGTAKISVVLGGRLSSKKMRTPLSGVPFRVCAS